MVNKGLSCAERNAGTLGNDVGYKSLGGCKIFTRSVGDLLSSSSSSLLRGYLFQAGVILTEPTIHEVTSIHPANTRTWPQQQQGLQQGEHDVRLAHDSEMRMKMKEPG